MTQIDKQIERFLQNPGTTKYATLLKILLHTGHEIVEAKGSHVKCKHHGLPHDLIIPVHGGECKAFYKKLAAKRVQEILK